MHLIKYSLWQMVTSYMFWQCCPIHRGAIAIPKDDTPVFNICCTLYFIKHICWLILIIHFCCMVLYVNEVMFDVLQEWREASTVGVWSSMLLSQEPCHFKA
jgi:hypothetical protein